jgi:Phage capsid family.
MNEKINFRSIILDADKSKGGREMRSALSLQTGQEALSIVSPLLENLVLAKAGATIMDGLDPTKDYVLPVASDNPAHWKDETGEDVSFAYTKLAPHTLIAQFEVSNLLLQQTEPSVDKFLINLATSAMSVEIEKAVLGSASTTTKPAGIFAGAAAITATHAGMIDLIHSVEAANAPVSSFILNAEIAQTLRKVETVGRHVMEGNNIAGYPALVSNASVGLAAGNWSDLVIGLYDSVWIITDPYSKAEQSISIVTISFDVAAHLLRDNSIARVI